MYNIRCQFRFLRVLGWNSTIKWAMHPPFPDPYKSPCAIYSEQNVSQTALILSNLCRFWVNSNFFVRLFHPPQFNMTPQFMIFQKFSNPSQLFSTPASLLLQSGKVSPHLKIQENQRGRGNFRPSSEGYDKILRTLWRTYHICKLTHRRYELYFLHHCV